MFDFLKKLFSKEPEDTLLADAPETIPLSPEQVEDIVANQAMQYELQHLVAASGQSVGKQRELNEDSLMSISTTIAGNAGNTPFGLYIVADGMGGHQYGEIASNTAIRTFGGHIMRKFHPYLFTLPTVPLDESLQDLMLEGVSQAQEAIQRDAPGSGTTLTAALVLGEQVSIAHVGDSRAYAVYPDGRFDLITRDHSLVGRLEELGQITAEEAETHPQKNVLYRALGQGEILEPDIFTVSFPKKGTLLICSDGLWGVLSKETMHQAISDADTLERACQNLVNAANAAGGPDNITVILAKMIG
ncbi:MAG: serine/threonine-protein phosphatase [Anaerolineae bacterium]|nr:serine/threonine-protein phosphatase [Anaerolineae bacterium]MBT4312334.1 serine/threonine-protein phosphatase [Anaerolineae bacterium]MBT4457352.1 serine/threonine-protein phosphatase [Anaerolineae bacterium]MBT4842895.1 serine/threonine-protein phosphatase [Anaerolineae bacterium]MBT6060235.1 serine/threonine-protein phosphatase [Anaerolineae bacterium]